MGKRLRFSRAARRRRCDDLPPQGKRNHIDDLIVLFGKLPPLPEFLFQRRRLILVLNHRVDHHGGDFRGVAAGRRREDFVDELGRQLFVEGALCFE